MKNRGFTLVELLAVIVILTMLVFITTISVGNIISNSKQSLLSEQEKTIEEAAKIYYLKEGGTATPVCVNLSDLIEKGYIDGKEVIDPKTSEPMVGSVKITREANQYTYKYEDKTTCFVCSKITSVEEVDTTIKLGDEINCGSENFYVINNNGSSVQMISKYNLNVGSSRYLNKTTYGLQDKNAIGVDSANKATFGQVAFYADIASTGNNGYWNASGIKYPVFIYNENSDVYNYVEDYKAYLIYSGLAIEEASLLNEQQLLNLGCTNYSNCTNAPTWLNSTSYWTGVASSSLGMVAVSTRNTAAKVYINQNCTTSNTYGVRPVITIPLSQIK